MAGGIGSVRSAVGVVAQCVVVLSSGVKLGGQRRVQALHAAPRAVLVWTLPQVGIARVKATRQVGGRCTERKIRVIDAAQRWVGSGLFLANLGNSEQQTGEQEDKTVDNNVHFGPLEA